VAAGVGQVGHVGVEVLAATGAVVLGVEHDDVAGPPVRVLPRSWRVRRAIRSR
jgi:hypothetical protein